MTDIAATRGDTNSYALTITRASALVNLTGATLVLTVRRKVDDTAAVAQVSTTPNAQGQIDLAANQSGAGKGLATAKILPSVFAGLPERSFPYDVQLTEADGTVTTVARGRLRLAADIT